METRIRDRKLDLHKSKVLELKKIAKGYGLSTTRGGKYMRKSDLIDLIINHEKQTSANFQPNIFDLLYDDLLVQILALISGLGHYQTIIPLLTDKSDSMYRDVLFMKYPVLSFERPLPLTFDWKKILLGTEGESVTNEMYLGPVLRFMIVKRFSSGLTSRADHPNQPTPVDISVLNKILETILSSNPISPEDKAIIEKIALVFGWFEIYIMLNPSVQKQIAEPLTPEIISSIPPNPILKVDSELVEFILNLDRIDRGITSYIHSYPSIYMYITDAYELNLSIRTTKIEPVYVLESSFRRFLKRILDRVSDETISEEMIEAMSIYPIDSMGKYLPLKQIVDETWTTQDLYDFWSPYLTPLILSEEAKVFLVTPEELWTYRKLESIQIQLKSETIDTKKLIKDVYARLGLELDERKLYTLYSVAPILVAPALTRLLGREGFGSTRASLIY